MAVSSLSTPECTLSLLSPLKPPSQSRAWFTAIHPHLPIVATCSSDKSVRIYSLTSFTLLSTISGGHKRSVRSCAWKPGVRGESVLATGSFDATVGVWKRWDQDDMTPKPESNEVDFTHGTNGLGQENDDNTDEDEEWRFALVLEGHDSEVKSIAWSAGGNFLATCSRDKSIWLWEEIGEDDFETVAVLSEHQGDVKCVAWHPEEELLASASYDDEIRLWKEDVDDWGCVGVLRGHESTVWAVEWEGLGQPTVASGGGERTPGQLAWLKRREISGPRLLSCSDDMTIRVWRRQPREKRAQQSKLSIIRTGSNEEHWVEEARLPQRHVRAIYSVCWSKKTGRIVSTAGDGKIVVYAERWKAKEQEIPLTQNSHSHENELDAMQAVSKGDVEDKPASAEWYVIAEIESAHGAFELNHVCWAPRADRGRKRANEEVVISTGDDGVVQVWTLDE